MTSLAAALAGGNLIYESSGMTASLLGASLEAFVIDDEMHAANYRILRGVEVNDDTLCYDAICSSVLNDGHFLGAQTNEYNWRPSKHTSRDELARGLYTNW